MKTILQNIICTAVLGISSLSLAQITAIDKTTTESTSSSLEFPAGQNKGIVLPYVSSAATVEAGTPVNGTLIYDRGTNRVRGLQNGTWVDFSTANGQVDATIQDTAVEEVNRKTVIGATSSTASGVLILEANNKAMLLPRMDSPHLNIKNPAAGMMAYDTLLKAVVFYNGTQWNFWK